MTQISAHISYKEATKSTQAIRLGLDNTPDELTLENMRMVADAVYEPLREHFGVAIGISSFYRSEAVNKAIGGSATSDHCKGLAIDMDMDGMPGEVSNADLFHYIRENLPFDQLIWEFGSVLNPDWVHASYRESGNRKQVLRAVRGADGRTSYKQWLP